MAGPPRYSAGDLIQLAARRGHPDIKRRLITDWAAKGLLDRPLSRGLGRGAGSEKGTWSQRQADLFLLLLDKRKETSKLATLCNLPVALWLYFGPAYAPVRQVRRALNTYGNAYRVTSARAARETAQLVTSTFGGKGVDPTASEQLAEAIVDATGGGPLDREKLLVAARAVFEQREDGSGESTPESWVRAIEARLLALASLDAISDERLEDVRFAHVETLRAYVGAPGLTHPQFERAVNSACLNLLTMLGVAELPGSGNEDEA